MAKVSKINIANAKIGADSADATANAPAITVVDARVGNNGVDVENALTIRVASDCLEETRKIAA